MERETYGVVLTAGSQVKASPVFENPKLRYVDEDGEFIYQYRERIEPDREGKMRFLSGFDDLQKGKFSKLLIAGGARNYGIPLAQIYFNYAKRFIRRYNLPEDSIQIVIGGTNTLSDLQKTEKMLKKQKKDTNLDLHSSGYHFERKSIQDFAGKRKHTETSFISAEQSIEKRHRLYGKVGRRLGLGPIGERILAPDFVEQMRLRNRRVDLLNKLHLTWIVQTGSYLLRR